MKFFAVALLTILGASVLGCSDPMNTDYDAHSNVVTCTVYHGFEGTTDKWTEKGYTCHSNPKERVRP